MSLRELRVAIKRDTLSDIEDGDGLQLRKENILKTFAYINS